MNEEKFYTPRELADRWNVSRSYISKLLRSGQIQGYHFGQLWRIRPDVVQAYEEAHMTELRPYTDSGHRVVLKIT